MRLRPVPRSARIVIAALAILLGATVVSAGINDQLAASVVQILSPPKVGTGVLLADDAQRGYLVTAAHVARDLGATTTLSTRGDKDAAISALLSTLVVASQPNWKISPDADLAVLRLDPSTEFVRERLKFLPASIVLSEKTSPSRDLTLTVFGFPLGLGAVAHFSPISRETKLASGLIDLPKHLKVDGPVLLTQDPSVGGFSGAPLFDTGLPVSSPEARLDIRKATVTLIGIVSGTISDETGGKLGVIVPGYRVHEALHAAGH